MRNYMYAELLILQQNCSQNHQDSNHSGHCQCLMIQEYAKQDGYNRFDGCNNRSFASGDFCQCPGIGGVSQKACDQRGSERPEESLGGRRQVCNDIGGTAHKEGGNSCKEEGVQNVGHGRIFLQYDRAENTVQSVADAGEESEKDAHGAAGETIRDSGNESAAADAEQNTDRLDPCELFVEEKDREDQDKGWRGIEKNDCRRHGGHGDGCLISSIEDENTADAIGEEPSKIAEVNFQLLAVRDGEPQKDKQRCYKTAHGCDLHG